MAEKQFRLYIDEAGDHTNCADPMDIGRRYLGLTGVMMPRDASVTEFSRRMEDFKRAHLPYDADDPPIIHREDILNRRYAFGVLRDDGKARAFDTALLDLVHTTDFTVISVVLDKVTHKAKSPWRLEHPYHYCLLLMLERYCGRLGHLHAMGDVLVESRGGTEDRAFKASYEKIYMEGSVFLPKVLAQATLSSRQVKLKGKDQNVAGLQLADVLAHPLARDVLVAYGAIKSRGGAFADRISQVVRPKYNRHLYDHRIKGYGQVIVR